MRFVVELTDGVTSKVSLSGTTSSATTFSQALTQVKGVFPGGRQNGVRSVEPTPG